MILLNALDMEKSFKVGSTFNEKNSLLRQYTISFES